MVTGNYSDGQNEDNGNHQNLNSPPTDPILQGKPTKDPFYVRASDVENTSEINLNVEFPMHQADNKAHNIGIIFKRFITILFAAAPEVTLLNWDHPNLNPITKSMDLQGTKEAVSQYFVGMQIHSNQKKILGLIKIKSPIPFWKIKQSDQFWSWITKNKIFVRPTTLSTKHHANIGWLLYSHPDYTNQRNAINDLRNRMTTRTLEFELTPH